MKRNLSKLLAFIMILCLTIPLFGNLTALVTVYAASPSLNETSKKIYMGTTFQLEVKNADQDNIKSVSWKSNRSSIAKVDKNGLVTPVKVGTTTIKCTLTYKDGKKTELACKAIVRIRTEATAVKITNMTGGTMNAQPIYVGNIFTIKNSVTPSNTTDTAYYISYDESIATVSTKGVITARAEGIATVEVRYGTSREDAMRSDNLAVAKMYVYITKKPDPTPTPSPTPIPSPTPTPVVLPEVTSVTMTGSQELQVNFSRPVIKSSVISGTKLVMGSVVLGKDEAAVDYGSILPVLSADRKQLTLSITGTFSGTYSVVISDKVQADGGVPFAPYAQVLSLKDITGPSYLYTSVGYTGWTSSINFNEPLDISSLSIEGVTGTTDAVLVNYLKDPANYTLSVDKKSILIDLSAYTSIKNLNLTVMLKGIRDTAGNATPKLLQNVTIRTDASSKPLAAIISTERTSREEIKVTFSSAISSPGMAKFGNDSIVGIVDSSDPTIVTYEIPYAYQSRTGVQIVEFSSWYNYNAVGIQNTPIAHPVDFTLDTTPPSLIKHDMVNVSANGAMICQLILTYDKEIVIASVNQQISVRAENSNGYISTLTPVSIYATVEGSVVTYSFSDTALMGNGNFSITLPVAMVADKLNNYSAATSFTLHKNGANSDTLPEPYSITQDAQDMNIIRLNFANQLDIASAEMIQNYRLASTGTSPKSASVIQQDDTTAVVELKFNPGAFTDSVSSYELIINGVKGYNGTYNAIADAHVLFNATENTPPAIANIHLDFSGITLTMSEEVMGSVKITATDPSTGLSSISGTGYASGKYIYITLDSSNRLSTYNTLRFEVTENNIYDVNGNKAAINLKQPYIARSTN